MLTLLSLQKKRDDALKAVAAATTETARSVAAQALDKASTALATFKASKLDSKSKTYVKKEERYEEEESADEDESADESADEDEDEKADDEPKKPLMKKKAEEKADEDEDESAEEDEDEDDEDKDSSDSDSDSDDDDDDDADEEEDEDEEEEEEKAKAVLSSTSGLYTYQRLFQLAQAVTGKRGVQEVFGALDGLGMRLKAAEKLEARIGKLEGARRRERVDAMLDTALREGRITRKAIPQLRAQGLQSVKQLRGLLDVLPKRVRTMEDGALEGRTFRGGKDGDAPEGAREEVLDAQAMTKEQRAMVEAIAADTGVEFDAFVDNMNKTRAKAGARRSASK